MEPKACVIRQLAIAGKFQAAPGFGPLLAGLKQRFGMALFPVFLTDKDTFQISDRAAVCTLHIIMAELALRKAGGNAVNFKDEKGGFLFFHNFSKFIFQALECM